jgi:hypothetical protein
MMIYIASDRPLPLIDWRGEFPAFHVRELRPQEEAVRTHFRKPFVYYVGSHEGCGCGFAYGQWPCDGEDYSLEDAAARRSVRRFSEYLASATRLGAVELYACWDGEQDRTPDDFAVASSAQIGGVAFSFKAGRFLLLPM